MEAAAIGVNLSWLSFHLLFVVNCFTVDLCCNSITNEISR